MEVLMRVFVLNMNLFFFDPIQTNLLFKSCKSELVESEIIVIKNCVLDQTLAHFNIKRLVDFGSTVLLRPLIHDNLVSRQMTHLLANFNYVYLFDVWA